MSIDEIVSGQRSAWALIRKLGEGDAGEVYLAESLMERQVAIVKRPSGKAFSNETLRQATQIKAEGAVLRLLNRYLMGNGNGGCRVPDLLDQNKPENGYGDRVFIVIQQAPGFDLNFLTRVSRGEQFEDLDSSHPLDPVDKVFLNSIQNKGKIPEILLLRVLSASLAFLEKVHHQPIEAESQDYLGVLWNDVKPDHIFWDPRNAAITLIDWGNVQFLAEDGRTTDHQRSETDDYRQWIEEMGKILSLAAPELVSTLGWPADIVQVELSAEGLAELSERLSEEFNARRQDLNAIRAREQGLLSMGTSVIDALPELDEIHAQILEFGELPDYHGALLFVAGGATMTVAADRLEELEKISAWALRLPVKNEIDWQLINRMAQLARQLDGQPHAHFLDAIQSAICADWSAALWSLLLAVPGGREPDWWYELSTAIRRRQIGVEADNVPPLLAVKRLVLAIQSTIQKAQDRKPSSLGEGAAPTAGMEALVRELREGVVPNWSAVDPKPPYAGLSYSDINGLLHRVGGYLPDAQTAIAKAIAQPQAQAQIALDAWQDKSFLTANNALRWILLWDPDRRRVLRADAAIRNAPAWLKKVHIGPKKSQPLGDFVTTLELEGRELRNQVGPAAWLDAILDGLAGLRKGAWPADLLLQKPALAREMPWLKNYERVEVVRSLPDDIVGADLPPESPPPQTVLGITEGMLGERGDLAFVEALDAWAPEARGSSARVFSGRLFLRRGGLELAAVKLMRMDKVDYSLPLFREEVEILALMRDVPGVNRLIECGFIQYEDGGVEPPDEKDRPLNELRGRLLRIGVDAAHTFTQELEGRIAQGWVPYLAVELRKREDNFLLLCDAGGNRGQYRPVTDLLQMSIQICDILSAAHQRNIVYRDHKILHYYWQEDTNGVYIIDWNVARRHPDGLTDVDVHMDLVQFGARGLHHILTGRAAPGALPLGPTRPEDIENAAQSYSTQWTYDDQRLSPDVREIIETVLAGGYTSAAGLRDDLKRAYMLLPNLH